MQFNAALLLCVNLFQIQVFQSIPENLEYWKNISDCILETYGFYLFKWTCEFLMIHMANSAVIGRFGVQVSIDTFMDKKTAPRFYYLYCIATYDHNYDKHGNIPYYFEWIKKIGLKSQFRHTFKTHILV